jgi:hypothetical protein
VDGAEWWKAIGFLPVVHISLESLRPLLPAYLSVSAAQKAEMHSPVSVVGVSTAILHPQDFG